MHTQSAPKCSPVSEPTAAKAEQGQLFPPDPADILGEIEQSGVHWKLDHPKQEDSNLLKGNRKPRERLPDAEATPHTSAQIEADKALKPYQIGVKLDVWIREAVDGGLPKSATAVLQFLREVSGKDPAKDNYLLSWHSQKAMATELDMKSRTLKWAISELRRCGLVATYRPRTNQGTWLRVRYTLCPGQLADESTARNSSESTTRQVSESTRGNSSESTRGNSSESTRGNSSDKIARTRGNSSDKVAPISKSLERKKSYRTGVNAKLEQLSDHLDELLAPLDLDPDTRAKATSPEYAHEINQFITVWRGRGYPLDEIGRMLRSRLTEIYDKGKTLTGVQSYLDGVCQDHGIACWQVARAIENDPHKVRSVVHEFLRGKENYTKLGSRIRGLILRA